MKTKVDLYLSQIPDTEITKQIWMTAESLSVTSVKKISVEIDKENPKKVIIQFESPKGRQMDLADMTMSAFSDHINTYSDISVYFEPTRKRR